MIEYAHFLLIGYELLYEHVFPNFLKVIEQLIPVVDLSDQVTPESTVRFGNHRVIQPVFPDHFKCFLRIRSPGK